MTWHVEHIAVLVILKALGTKRDTLIESDMIADDTRLADDDTRAVVNGEIFADLCTRMDVNTCLRMGQLGDNTRYDGNTQLVQLMGDTVVRHSVHHRITENHLAIVGSSRVVVEHGLYVGIEQSLDFGKCIEKLQRQPLSFLIHLLLGLDILTIFAKLQAVGNLFCQQALQFLHVYTNIVGTNGLVGLALVEVIWEDDTLGQSDNLFYLLDRRQGSLRRRHHTNLLRRHTRQEFDILKQYVVTILIHRWRQRYEINFFYASVWRSKYCSTSSL